MLSISSVALEGDASDKIVDATPALVGTTLTECAIDDLIDVDMYALDVTIGQTIALDIDRPAGSRLNSYLRVFDEAGLQLAVNDNGRAAGEYFSVDSYLSYAFPAAGRYYVGVSSSANRSYNPVTGEGDRNGTVGAYTLTLTPTGDFDDQILEATPISLGNAVAGQELNPGNDVDMYSLTVEPGATLVFDINRPAGSTLDSYLRLFNAAGQELASNNNGPTPGEAASNDPYLKYTSTAGGTYYVGVSSSSNTAYNAVTGLGDRTGGVGAYTLLASLGLPSVQLASVAWSGSGQVVMWKQGADSWQNDSYGDRGDRTIPTGLENPVWLDSNGDGDAVDASDINEPIAFVRNSSPVLRATLSGLPSTPVSVRAVSTDPAMPLVFTGYADPGAGSSLNLATSQTVGSAIQSRDLTLRWEIAANGSDYAYVGSSTHSIFVLYGQPLDPENNSPTARRIAYGAGLAAGESWVLNIADKIAQNAMRRFFLYRVYSGEDAWNVLRYRADCGSNAWLMHNALHMLGAPAEVRYVFPVTGSWNGLWGYQPEHRPLGFVGPGMFGTLTMTFNWYQGCCYVTDGASVRYYLGGWNGLYKPSAYDVLLTVSGPNTSPTGQHQCYQNNQSMVIPYPPGRPPAELPTIQEAAMLALLADESLYPTGASTPLGRPGPRRSTEIAIDP